jgi:polysaccharide export outer membrane protein
MLFETSLTHLNQFMKKCIDGAGLTHWVTFCLVVLALSSCRSNKDLSYLMDAQNNKTLTNPPANDEYKVQINDNLYVSVISPNTDMNELYNPAVVGNNRNINNVWSNLEGQFVQGYLVEPDGTITLPAIGKIAVVGLTIREAENKIKAKAQEYLKDVTAKVRLLNYKVTVIGEVNDPGVYYNYNYEYTVFDAISSAGGITNAAKLEKVLVLRRTKTGSQTFTLNMNSLSALSSPAYFLEPNDVIMIQPSKYKNVQLRLPIYTAAISTITAIVFYLNYLDDPNN